MAKLNKEKLLSLAATMNKQAEEKMRPRETHTAKKLAQARHAELEGARLKRAADLIESLCQAIDEDRVPEILLNEKLTKDFFLMAGRLETKRVSNGYHDYLVEGSNYSHNDPQFQALRCLDRMSPEKIAEQEARQREFKLRRAIDNVRNRDIPGFFPTPKSVIRKMLSIVDQHTGKGSLILEPSAGLGDIVDEIRETCRGVTVDAIEINHELCEILKMKNINVEQADFETWETDKRYDCIVMNPPYEKKQAIKHTIKAFGLLKPGGALVSLMPPNHAQDVLDGALDCDVFAIEPVEDGAFNTKESFRRTGVSVAILYAVKPSVDTDSTEELADLEQGLLF